MARVIGSDNNVHAIPFIQRDDSGRVTVAGVGPPPTHVRDDCIECLDSETDLENVPEFVAARDIGELITRHGEQFDEAPRPRVYERKAQEARAYLAAGVAGTLLTSEAALRGLTLLEQAQSVLMHVDISAEEEQGELARIEDQLALRVSVAALQATIPGGDEG